MCRSYMAASCACALGEPLCNMPRLLEKWQLVGSRLLEWVLTALEWLRTVLVKVQALARLELHRQFHL